MPSDPESILYLSTFGNFRWGGQKSLFYLVTRLDRQKYRPYVLLPTDEDFAQALRQLKIPVIIQDIPPIRLSSLHNNITALYKLSIVIKRFNIKLIHTDGPRNTLYAGFVALLKRIPIVFHVRASDQDRLDRIIYRFSDRIILVANALRHRFNWIENEEKFITVYNGVDIKQFDLGLSSVHILEKKKSDDPDRSLSIVCIGRIEPSKGQIFLIEACRHLYDRQIPFHLIFAGDIVNTEYLSECEHQAQNLGINDRVTFTGHLENILEVLNRTDVFVLPSLSEAFSRAIIEAMAMGKPVIATAIGGTAEAVEDGKSGFVVPPKDHEKLAERLIELAKNEKLRRQFGAAARKRVEDLFTIEKNVQKIEQIYQEILECNNH